VEWLSDPQIWAGLLTLTALEIVLGIDNLVFITILAGRLPTQRQNRARQVGLALALVTRLALLGSIAWIIGLTQPIFELFGHAVSWRDVILIGGGFFLLYKGTREIHRRLEGDIPHESAASDRTSFGTVIVQIVLLDIVFSLDSVITAVGMANEFWVMATAVVIAVFIILAASGPLSDFVNRHPTVKMLALSFFAADRHDLGRRRCGPSCAEGVHLRRHRLLCWSRSPEPARRASSPSANRVQNQFRR
jgi:predicted tellurium resistance membrane protein TerC